MLRTRICPRPHDGAAARRRRIDTTVGPRVTAAWTGALLVAELAVDGVWHKVAARPWRLERGNHIAWSVAVFLAAAAAAAAGLVKAGPVDW